jgi:diadenosine tetraphosphate (Ap4A) HIT family hydrolase
MLLELAQWLSKDFRFFTVFNYITLRAVLAPLKINLASFGNMTPHLHWHVIARFEWDSHFPQPIWGTRQRTPEPAALARLAAPLATLDERLRLALQAAFPS